MAAAVRGLVDYYHNLMDTYGDPRTKGYPMMDSPWPTLAIVGTYILIVKYIGPKLMESRKPFQLKKCLIWYNIIEIVVSAYAIYEAYIVGWFTHYSWNCQPIDRSDTPLNRRLIRGVWLYYLSKFFELFDTIFFVLRKKNQQVSKLHVYHHSIMPINSWITAKFVPGGHGTFGGVMNSFVHVIMYTYYLLAALGPGMKKYLWWKKYLTVLQMGQFVIIFLHSMQLLYFDCDFPRPFAYFLLGHASVFLVLFKNFYDSAYKDGKTKVAESVRSGSQPEEKQERKEVSEKREKTDKTSKKSVARNRKRTAKIEASR